MDQSRVIMEILTKSFIVIEKVFLSPNQDSNITSIIAMVAAIFSAVAAIASGILIYKQIKATNEHKKQDNLNQVVNNLIIQRQHYYTTVEALYRWEHRGTNQWKYVFQGVLRAYLNAYEYACAMYIGDKIDKNLFEAMFKNEIVAIYENDLGADYGLSIREEKNIEKHVYCDIRKVAKMFGAKD